MNDQDIRINLLLELNKFNKGTEEFVANEFLSKLHGDLGTIRRLLMELIDFDLIRESNVSKDDHIKSVIRNIQSTKQSNDDLISWGQRKSSQRLVEKVGEFEKVPDIRITITINGIQFLIENEKLDYDLTLAKWQKIWFWPVAIIAIIGFILSILSFFNIL